jgi:tetratricopeptide (TPR) repeat protein
MLLAAPLLCGLASPAAAADPDPDTQALLDEIKEKEPQERLRALKMRVDEGQPSKEIWFHLGNAYYETNNINGAIQAFESAVQMDPKFFKAMVNLALMYDENESWAKAIETFERASEINAENPDVWSHLGNTYYAQGKYEEAMSHYRMALAVDPDATHALYSMGIAFADAGIFREAVRYWTRVSQLEPDSELGHSASENVELLQKYLIPK